MSEKFSVPGDRRYIVVTHNLNSEDTAMQLGGSGTWTVDRLNLYLNYYAWVCLPFTGARLLWEDE
jgi:hypothetical protein